MFLVLAGRSKPSVAWYLQVYHHATTSSVAWVAWFFPGPSFWVGAITNTFVHVVMCVNGDEKNCAARPWREGLTANSGRKVCLLRAGAVGAGRAAVRALGDLCAANAVCCLLWPLRRGRGLPAPASGMHGGPAHVWLDQFHLHQVLGRLPASPPRTMRSLSPAPAPLPVTCSSLLHILRSERPRRPRSRRSRI